VRRVDAADNTDRFHQERRVVAVRCSFDDDPAFEGHPA
jgi:hypothetical protein